MKAPLTKEGYRKRLNGIRRVRREVDKMNVNKLHENFKKAI